MACEAKAMGENREFDDEALVSRLRDLGVRFLGPTPSQGDRPVKVVEASPGDFIPLPTGHQERSVPWAVWSTGCFSF
jgi:hypothetical protein